MFSDERKLHLIEELLKVDNEHTWMALEHTLKNASLKTVVKKPSIYDFVGIISEKEARESNKFIAEICDIVDENDWK